ncbi:hypothetical protein HGB24_03145 [Candidatus Saccharibacteria bacterium]|nr:hypothetical protein [Candidatus Saccharibacteria bacterium]
MTQKIVQAIKKDFSIEQKISQNPSMFVENFLSRVGIVRGEGFDERLLNVFPSDMHVLFHLWYDCLDEIKLAKSDKHVTEEQFIVAFVETCKEFGLHTKQSDPYYIERILKKLVLHRNPATKPYLGTRLHLLVPYTAYLIGKYGYKTAYVAMAEYILPNEAESYRNWLLDRILLPEDVMCL